MTCQKCHKEVKNPTAIFCYWCGAVLEQPTNTTSLTEETEKKEMTPKAKSSKKLLLGVLPVLAVTLVLGTLFVLKITPFSEPATVTTVAVVESTPQTEVAKPESIELTDATFGEPFLFGISKFESLVPQDIIYYSEGTDLESKLTPENTKKLEVLLTSVFDLSTEEALTYFSSDFGYFCNKVGCGIMLATKDAKSLATKLEGVTFKPTEFSLELFDTTALIYQNKEVKDAVLEVSQHLTKSLGMDSKYLTVLKEIPKKGALMLYVANSNDIDKELANSDLSAFGTIPDDTLEKIASYAYILSQDTTVNLYYK